MDLRRILVNGRRHRRPNYEAQEKPVLPQPDTDASLPDFPEEVVQAKEESIRSTRWSPQCGHLGGGSSERKTRVSKQLLQQQQ